jgi:hypothetical protein
MFGIMRRRPWLAVKVVVRAPVVRAPWTAPAAPASDGAPDVLPALRGVFIRELGHGARGRDGVDGDYLGEGVGYISDGRVAVDHDHFLAISHG